jgi:hypothetical protein
VIEREQSAASVLLDLLLCLGRDLNGVAEVAPSAAAWEISMEFGRGGEYGTAASLTRMLIELFEEEGTSHKRVYIQVRLHQGCDAKAMEVMQYVNRKFDGGEAPSDPASPALPTLSSGCDPTAIMGVVPFDFDDADTDSPEDEEGLEEVLAERLKVAQQWDSADTWGMLCTTLGAALTAEEPQPMQSAKVLAAALGCGYDAAVYELQLAEMATHPVAFIHEYTWTDDDFALYATSLVDALKNARSRLVMRALASELNATLGNARAREGVKKSPAGRSCISTIAALLLHDEEAMKHVQSCKEALPSLRAA